MLQVHWALRGLRVCNGTCWVWDPQFSQVRADSIPSIWFHSCNSICWTFRFVNGPCHHMLQSAKAARSCPSCLPLIEPENNRSTIKMLELSIRCKTQYLQRLFLTLLLLTHGRKRNGTSLARVIRFHTIHLLNGSCRRFVIRMFGRREPSFDTVGHFDFQNVRRTQLIQMIAWVLEFFCHFMFPFPPSTLTSANFFSKCSLMTFSIRFGSWSGTNRKENFPMTLAGIT